MERKRVLETGLLCPLPVLPTQLPQELDVKLESLLLWRLVGRRRNLPKDPARSSYHQISDCVLSPPRCILKARQRGSFGETQQLHPDK